MLTHELAVPLLVVGGGVGGVAAALTAARLGQRVVLTEETSWLGGQLTSQAVPPDEHEWIETASISPSWSELRENIREHYRRHYPLTREARMDPFLNPGMAFVSRLCHEPRVGALVIDELLSPLIAAGLLTVLREHTPVRVDRDGSRIEAVVLLDLREGAQTRVQADTIIDATELGDLLELGNVEYVIGAEASSETGELHAHAVADPLDQQAVTWCAALEYGRPNDDNIVARPAGYHHWRTAVAPFWPGPQLSWDDVEPITLAVRRRPIFYGEPDQAVVSDDFDLWHYRRALARRVLEPDWPSGDITLLNWPQIDYWDRPLLGVSEDQRRLALEESRELTLSFVHWMQTEAPRPDGGAGYPGLRLRGDVVGTTDGLAMSVYVREARRIRALFTVTEEHIGVEMRDGAESAATFPDSVGIGSYRIDLHPSTSGRTYIDIPCHPFQIPLGALIPEGVDNLIAGAKNIGTTHISNGAYRLHPVEWSIGEAAGALAVFTRGQLSPQAVRETPSLLEDYQRLLSDRLGVSLDWNRALTVPRPRPTGIAPRSTSSRTATWH